MDVEEDESGGVADATVIAADFPWSLARAGRVIEQIKADLDEHDSRCPERILGIALHPDDHASSRLHSIGSHLVLGWDEVEKDRVQLLCECSDLLIPDVEGPEDLLNFCEFGTL